MVFNTIKKINDEYSTIRISSDTYDHTVLFDTKYAKYIAMFSWNKLHTDDKGVYFAARNTHYTHENCIKQLGVPIEEQRQLLFHRLVAYMAKLPNPENLPTVDHINRETLDNRAENLRWLSQANQNRNTDKRNRKVNARPLPDDITGPLPKYVTWNITHEKTSSEKLLERKFFRVEKHPAQPAKKIWSSSKSAKLTNQEKLNQALAELARLNKLLDAPDPHAEQLLKDYFSLTTVHEPLTA
jgi:hypothetical protein